MNNNDILRIAKSLYLQEVISRQLFAKFNPNKQLDVFSGSFAKLPQRIQAAFYPFIGSQQRTPYPQIVEKNGMKFKIHKINIDNTVSDQIYNNTEYNINQIAFILRKLYVTAQKGGQNSFKNNIKELEVLWKKFNKTKNIVQNAQTIIDKLEQIKQVFIAISNLIVGDISFINITRSLQEGISLIQNQQSMDINSEQYITLNNTMLSFINDFKVFANNKASYVATINMAVNRLKSFVELYNELKKRSNQLTDNEELQKIVLAMQTCNNNTQINGKLRNLNLKNYLDQSFTNMTKQDDSLQSFIRFIKNIDDSRIEFSKAEEALLYYLDLADGVLTESTKSCLQQLYDKICDIQEHVKIIAEKDKDDLQGKDHILYSKQLGQKMINQIKNCRQQLI